MLKLICIINLLTAWSFSVLNNDSILSPFFRKKCDFQAKIKSNGCVNLSCLALIFLRKIELSKPKPICLSLDMLGRAFSLEQF